MAAIWRRENSEWKALSATDFPSEEALHDLVEDSPQLLPLSGSPALVVVGREVNLGFGKADLIAVEPDGRIVVLEIKLHKNAEARRAVVAQILTYAAYLKGLDVATLEGEVLRTHLAERDFASLADAVQGQDQSGVFQPAEFADGLSESLLAGDFRLVLVLDEAPPELVQLVGYLESISAGITLDLITVATYEVGSEEILVPQRVDPEHQADISEEGRPATRRKKLARSIAGSDAFAEAIESAPAEHRPGLQRLLRWARTLDDEGLVTLSTYYGEGREILLVWVKGDKGGLAAVWNDGGPYIQLWRSVFVRRAPDSIAKVEDVLGQPIGQGNTLRDPSDDVLDALTEAYRQAATGEPTWNGRDFYVSFGEGNRRSWDDAREYGFVAAGGGAWHSRSLQQLEPGKRVFAYISKGNGVGGYVGVGDVTGAPVPASEFTVEHDGRTVPITEIARARDMGANAGDPDLCEYVVPVRWTKALPKEEAIKDSDFFANQNSAVKLTHGYTLRKLETAFDVGAVGSAASGSASV